MSDPIIRHRQHGTGAGTVTPTLAPVAGNFGVLLVRHSLDVDTDTWGEPVASAGPALASSYFVEVYRRVFGAGETTWTIPNMGAGTRGWSYYEIESANDGDWIFSVFDAYATDTAQTMHAAGTIQHPGESVVIAGLLATSSQTSAGGGFAWETPLGRDYFNLFSGTAASAVRSTAGTVPLSVTLGEPKGAALAAIVVSRGSIPAPPDTGGGGGGGSVPVQTTDGLPTHVEVDGEYRKMAWYALVPDVEPPPPPPPPPADTTAETWAYTTGARAEVQPFPDGYTATGEALFITPRPADPVVAPPTGTALTSDPDANAATRTMLATLASYGPKTGARSFLYGQHTKRAEGTAGLDTIKAQSGFDVAMMGMDVSERYTTAMLNQAVAHWNAGGYVQVIAHSPNPVTGLNGFEDVNSGNPGAVNHATLLNPGSSAHTNLLAHLNDVCDFFDALAAQGVSVIFRPLHEVTNSSFWWCPNQNSSVTPARHRALWAFIRNHVINTRGCHNVLFWWGNHKNFNSASSSLGTRGAAWTPLPEHVDGLGGSHYGMIDATIPSVDVGRWNSWFAAWDTGGWGSKPVSIVEGGGETAGGSGEIFDARALLDAMNTVWPGKFCYAMTWTDGRHQLQSADNRATFYASNTPAWRQHLTPAAVPDEETPNGWPGQLIAYRTWDPGIDARIVPEWADPPAGYARGPATGQWYHPDYAPEGVPNTGTFRSPNGYPDFFGGNETAAFGFQTSAMPNGTWARTMFQELDFYVDGQVVTERLWVANFTVANVTTPPPDTGGVTTLDLAEHGEDATGVVLKAGSSAADRGAVLSGTVGGRTGTFWRGRHPGPSSSLRWGTDWRCAFDQMAVPLPPADEYWMAFDVYHFPGWLTAENAPGDRKMPGLAGYDTTVNRIGDVDDANTSNERHRDDQWTARWMAQGRNTADIQGIGYLNVWKLGDTLHNDNRANSNSGLASFYQGLQWRVGGNQSASRVNIPKGWATVEQHVKMNTPGQSNGVIEWWVNGALVASRFDIGYRSAAHPNLRINALNLCYFHGGPVPAENPTEPTETWFDNFRFSRTGRIT